MPPVTHTESPEFLRHRRVVPPPDNRLLSGLPADELRELRPHFQRIPLQQGQVLESRGAPIRHVHFPESGIASVFAITSDGRRLEVGMFGREGMSGMALLLGADRTPHETFIQVSGEALRICAAELLPACRRSPALRDRLLRYVQAATVHSAHTALSHGVDVIEARLARWLLMCHDRMDGDEAPLTHQQLGTALGVRRSGVTNALHILEGLKLVRATRGCITVLDRSRLEEIAGESYGVPEAEFERLLAAPIRPS